MRLNLSFPTLAFWQSVLPMLAVELPNPGQQHTANAAANSHKGAA